METSLCKRCHWPEPVAQHRTMHITQMPAVGAAALGRAGNHPSLFYWESNVLISDFLKLLPEKNARLLLHALVLHWPDVAGMQRQQ